MRVEQMRLILTVQFYIFSPYDLCMQSEGMTELVVTGVLKQYLSQEIVLGVKV